MAKRSKVAFRNKSPYGWWIVGEVTRWHPKDPSDVTPTSRLPVHENMRLLRAKTREQAYRRAIKLANAGMPSMTFGGEWRFEGLSFLLPVYEELEDGAEIQWTDHGTVGDARVRRLVKAKHELSVFDDSET